MKYLLSFDSPLQHLIKIQMEIHDINTPELDLKLPFWRPGRYEASNYAKNIQRFKVFDSNEKELAYEKINHSTWRIKSSNTSTVFVEYTYYAHQMDAGNSWYDENQIYINFVNCMMYNEDRMDSSCEVHLDIPINYKIACGLENKGRILLAKDYYQLADSPMIASEDLQCLEYSACDIKFYIWIQGEQELDFATISEQFFKFSEYQILMMGGFHEKEYHFLFQFPSHKFYHGVEHGNSTVICIGPGKDLNAKELYSELLGVSSHELYHAWNIIKIRPKELLPYDFGKSASFPTGYVAEGFTTYYGDIFLVRSQVFDKNWYFNELNTLFKRHFLNFGRLNNSVVDSSIDLWIDGYQPSAPHKKSSIYVEGAMIALTLDLLIRKKTNDTKSLDDVMRVLYNEFGKKNAGYSKTDIQNICEALYGESLSDYFKDHVYGTASKEMLMNELLDHVGCVLVFTDSEKFLEREIGLKIVFEKDEYRVMSTVPDSIGEEYFSIKDKIMAINGVPISENNLNNLSVGALTFDIERNNKSKTIKISTDEKSYLKNPSISQIINPSESQKDSFEKWLSVAYD